MATSFSSDKSGLPYSASPTSTVFHNKSGTESTAHGEEECQESKLKRELSLNTDYKGPVIPPSTKERRKQRTLILCFDGTGDQFDNDNSNVVQFFSLLKKGDSMQQLCYYQAGIGTYTIPQIATPLYSSLAKTWDMMLGSSLNHHVMGGYEFLMENFRNGDRICIFGFSRGAYTARALAGMIEKVGLLPAGNHQQVPFAYKMYMKDDPEGWEMSADFKRTFSINVQIEFVGVWDTVDSVGLVPRHIPFTKHNSCVKTFRHAMSLDEHRVKFKPNLFDKVVNVDTYRCDLAYTPFSTKTRNIIDKISHLLHGKKKCDNPEEHEDKYNRGVKLQDQYTDSSKQTNVLEVWFAGCHTDVGGGSVPNKTRHSLARIPLRWMIRECFETNCGIQFEAERLHSIGMDPRTLYPRVLQRPDPLPLSSIVLPHHAGHPDEGKKLKKKPMEIRVICGTCPDEEPERLTREESEGTIVDTATDKDHELGVFAQEEHEELHDALQPMFDQLQISKGWWILEMVPLIHRVQKRNGEHVKVLSINGGRSRHISSTLQKEVGINVHRSVKLRMQADAYMKKYTPRLKFEVEPNWIS
ncbi:hypothetical protein SCHPADRAFT_32706 [Schizopora paradoxa]|uniref:T6SS Phospholipase effector Tle1-like catalytic domain-containing protein n=1 Tax=Schizopora paradoxa TaxID=27342 RepID=A0A0H2SSS0_9AGAM|nr:hypothetical protein SCHPADRAFT_32706 [Schizopora paradoxa]